MSQNASGKADGSTSNENKGSSVRVCPDCGNEYANRSGLRHHVNNDNNECTGYECPTCDRNLVSERGVKLHHKKEHGESIFGTVVECANCGKEHRKSKSRVKNTKVNYCSPDCQAEHYATEDSPITVLTGEDSPFYNSIKYDCDNCGKEMLRKMCRVDENECLYCSPQCHYEGLSERYSDGGHPLFEGGYEYYGHNWDEIAKEVREDYEYKCQGCGTDQSELDHALNVHHVTPLRKFDSYKEANRKENLVPLCDGCHRVWEGLNLKPELVSET